MEHIAHLTAMTAEEFLVWEARQIERHEFFDGKVLNRTGSDAGHNLVTGNIALALRQHLLGTPDRVFAIAMMIAAADDRSFFYPDVIVTCSPADRQSPLIKREPTLIAEVLSPSTAAYDLGGKFAHYRQIPTLREIAFIDLDARRADVYRKGADGLWVLHPFEAGADVQLASVDLTITAAALFAEVDEAPRESGIPA